MYKLSIPAQWISSPIRILVIGCGGTGSEVLNRLFKMNHTLRQLAHPGFHVTAADGDAVSPANIGRQAFYHCDIGHNKAETLITRFNQFSDFNWRFIDNDFRPTDSVMDYSLVITCVDSANFRVQLGQQFENSSNLGDRLWLDSGNGKTSGQIILGHANNPKFHIPNVYQLFPDLKDVQDDPTESCSTEEAIAKQNFGINSLAAECATNLLWDLIRNGQTHHHGYYFENSPVVATPMPIDPLQWQLIGYDMAGSKAA